MSILSWWRNRQQRKRDAYARNFGNATPEEAREIQESRKLIRNRLKVGVTGGLRDGKGISPTGTPIDFTADEESPRY